MRVCMCLCVCSKSSLKQLGQLKPNFMWNHIGVGEFIQRILVICCSSFEYCQPLGAGAFRGAFTTNLAPQCRAFSRALEGSAIPRSEGAWDTNDWCIMLNWYFRGCNSVFDILKLIPLFTMSSQKLTLSDVEN